MKLILGYTDKKGACWTMPIEPFEVEKKLKWLWKKRYEAVVWEEDDRNSEVGWVWRHEEAGWSWCMDNFLKKS